MPSFLLFTLHAPMASWGDVAVGERRTTWRVPSRSAILGLCGAALGIQRDDSDAQHALAREYRAAVRVDAGGAVAEDYQTIQAVAVSNVRRAAPATRAELLAHPERETILSRRRYLDNSLFTAAVWATPLARWSLAQLAAALVAPTFVLYAGRKAHPLGLPMRPEVLEAETLAIAFGQRPALPDEHPMLEELGRRLRGPEGWGREVHHDPCEDFDSGLVTPLRREVRRDVPLTRSSAWQFVEREVLVGSLPAIPESLP
jgi:CRISPR system Cascade subunit CasD